MFYVFSFVRLKRVTFVKEIGIFFYISIFHNNFRSQGEQKSSFLQKWNCIVRTLFYWWALKLCHIERPKLSILKPVVHCICSGMFANTFSFIFCLAAKRKYLKYVQNVKHYFFSRLPLPMTLHDGNSYQNVLGKNLKLTPPLHSKGCCIGKERMNQHEMMPATRFCSQSCKQKTGIAYHHRIDERPLANNVFQLFAIRLGVTFACSGGTVARGRQLLPVPLTAIAASLHMPCGAGVSDNSAAVPCRAYATLMK